MLLLIHFLRAVEAAETDTFRVLIVQHFEGVAVEDGVVELGCEGRRT